MSQIFKVNGLTFDYITNGDWVDETAGAGLDGSTGRQRAIVHTWRGEAMPMDEWNALYNLEGTIVILTTTNYTDRNGAYRDYYNVICERVDGRHESVNVVGVTADFRVML